VFFLSLLFSNSAHFNMGFFIFYHMYKIRANHGNWKFPMVKVLSRFCESPYGNESDRDWIQSVVYAETTRVTDVMQCFNTHLHLFTSITMVELMDVLQHDVKGNPRYSRPKSCRCFLEVIGLSAKCVYDEQVLDGCFLPPLLVSSDVVEALSPSRVILA